MKKIFFIKIIFGLAMMALCSCYKDPLAAEHLAPKFFSFSTYVEKTTVVITCETDAAYGVAYNYGVDISLTPDMNESWSIDYYDNLMGTISFTTSDVLPNNTYYYRIYLSNGNDWIYSDVESFYVEEFRNMPTVTTSTVTYITKTTAYAGGSVISDGDAEITSRGVCYSSWSTTPTLDDMVVECGKGIGAFSCYLNYLSPGTTYYVRAYAINSVGMSYGSTRTFTTLAEEECVWSLFGLIEGYAWSKDFDMTETSDGIWVSDQVLINGEFKIRKNHSWDDDRGGEMVSLGIPFHVEKGGPNIILPVLNTYYVVTYNSNTETVTVVSYSTSASVVTGAAWQTDSEYSSTGFYVNGDFKDFDYQFEWNLTLTLSHYEQVKEVGFLMEGWKYYWYNLSKDGDYTSYVTTWTNDSSIQMTYQAYAELYTGERIYGAERTVTLSYGKTGQLSDVVADISKELDMLIEERSQVIHKDGESMGECRYKPMD